MTWMSNTSLEKFFHGPFQTMLEGVSDVPNVLSQDFPLSQSSWDRKAAYLLWSALGQPGDDIDMQAMAERLGFEMPEPDVTPATCVPAIEGPPAPDEDDLDVLG